MTHREALIICQDLAEAYPGTVFFAPTSFNELIAVPGNENKWNSEYRDSQYPLALHIDPQNCFRALQQEQAHFEKAPAVLIAMRAPWPEDIASGDPARIRGRQNSAHTSLDDDPHKWREKGRLIEIVIPPETVHTTVAIDIQNYNWLRDQSRAGQANHPIFTLGDFGNAKSVVTHCHFAYAFSWYNSSDSETAAFMATFRKLYSSQVTCRLAWYDPKTDRYLDKYRSRFRTNNGRDLLRWLCHNPGTYLQFTSLDGDNPGYEGRLGAAGPAPDFKAEVFLEEGLPIDDIEGLTAADKNKLKRRFEKKQRQKAKAADAAGQFEVAKT